MIELVLETADAHNYSSTVAAQYTNSECRVAKVISNYVQLTTKKNIKKNQATNKQ